MKSPQDSPKENATGDAPAERAPNRLIHETSPYLLQHARNPVDWYPWGEEAFEKARRESKPIFLSVGYSSCHWCHVMERESFEDEEIARVLNQSFVPVKVDREERPDVDAIYMTAVQMMTRQGGWPLSVFLTPELRPFFGGTYFPPRALYGRPGFLDLLRNLDQHWKAQRERVVEIAENLGRALKADAAEEGAEPASDAEPPGLEAEEAAFAHDRQTFDRDEGGFGGAPKFPRSIELSRILIHHHRTGDPEALAMVDLTLRKMAAGGMFDQVGGGFHRYSTDEMWLVPHFEKMLYDNALLARAYLEGWQATGDEAHLRVAREILDYIRREMTGPEGGFYSATDADSEGEEGRFFVWDPAEVERLLGREPARAFCLRFGITEGGNFEGKSIAHHSKSVAEVARALQAAPERVEEWLREGRERLYLEREKRPKPLRDEKVIASWNALMISAMARAGAATGERTYLAAAAAAERFIRERMMPEGGLLRIHKDGRSRFPAYLDDHAYLLEALIDLHEATFEPAYLDRARLLADRMLSDFRDPSDGGLFYSAEHHRDLIARRKDPFDNATPAASGVAALSLLRLAELMGEAGYRERAREVLASLRRAIERVPMGFASTLIALDFYHQPRTEIAVIGDPASPAGSALLRAIHRRYIPRKVLTGATAMASEELAKRIPLLAGRGTVDGKPTVYLCRDFTCEKPITELKELEGRIEGLARPASSKIKP